MILAVIYGRNFSDCVEKSEKIRTSTEFEPVTSRERCNALTNSAMKPLTLGAGHLWVNVSVMNESIDDHRRITVSVQYLVHLKR